MDELWRSEDANTVVKEAPVGGGGVDCSNDADALAIALKEKEKQREQQLEIVKAEKEHDPLEQQVVLTTTAVTDSSSSTIATIATAIAKKKRHFEEVEPVVWHLSHRPSGEKTRKKLTLHDDIAQIGFGGCGGMYNYFLGVASVLQEEYDLENVIFSGVSAGCFPAMILALGIDVKEFFFKENIPLIEHAASCSYSGLGKWIPLVKANTLKMLPEDAYKQANQKLYFSVTELPALKNHVITTWENNEDMVDCMLSSGHVPLYTDSLVSTYRGMKLVDGGLSNNSPIVHPDRPHKMLQIWKWRWISPTWILVTTNADWALEMFRMGREDALKNLHEIEDAFFPAHVAKRTRLAFNRSSERAAAAMSMKMLDEDVHLADSGSGGANEQQQVAIEVDADAEQRDKRLDSRSRLLKQRGSSSSASGSTTATQRKRREGSTSSSSGVTSTTTASAATGGGAGGRKFTKPNVLPLGLSLSAGGADDDCSSGSTLFTPPSSSLAQVNSTTCLVARPLEHGGEDEDDDDEGGFGSSGSGGGMGLRGKDNKDAQRRKTQERKKSGATKITVDTIAKPRGPSYTSPRRVAVQGKFRYLKPEEIQRGQLPKYDFAVIANRSVKIPSRVGKLLSDCLCCCCHPGGGDGGRGSSSSAFSESSSHERMGFRRLCLVNSPLLRESEDEHRRIVDKLVGQGLLVDIIDGGHSKGEMNSAYFILLIRASDEVVDMFVDRFRFHLWMEHGAVADMEQDIVGRTDPPTPAERVQIVDYIIEQRANITTRDPWIHDMFPMHDKQLTDKLISKWIASWHVVELVDKKILKQLRYNFGEKVSYYFAFFNYYNQSLIPIAAIGVLLQFLHGFIPTETYMRILPFWGIGVSTIWSFTFLKSWERKNASMQYEWNKKLHVKQIEYANKYFFGEKKVNSLTGEMEIVYPAWRRIPKYFCVFLFMLFQTVIMLILVAVWVTIYEMLKAKYTESHIFSTQWFLILLEGMVFGIFVDVIQWNMVVTKMGALFTHWENYRTEEQYERSLIRKLFLLDFLNYYTWFFSLAFVFVIPGFGDYLTNSLNHMAFGDAMNCCFGPYVDQHGVCIICPLGPKDATCIECVGYFTFDRHHVDLSAMFVTPIVVTQLLNIALGVLMPKLVRAHRERAQASADAEAQKRVMETGSMKILGSLDYEDKKSSQFGNKSNARYLEYTASEIEVLNKKAREILFDSEQDSYDPYNDFHALTVQYGFTVMFSILWPLMPFVCYLINVLKFRTDGYRLCKTLKRPIPRRANGIGAWKGILTAYAYIAVIVNVLLICISTGALEFFDDTCVRDIRNQLEKQGKTMNDFVLGPDFGCLHVTWRLLIILILEHLLIGIAYLIMMRVPKVPEWIHIVMNARENQFKELLRDHEHDLFPPNSNRGNKREFSSSRRKDGDTAGDDDLKEKGVRLSESRIDMVGLVSRSNRMSAMESEIMARNISIDSVTPVSERDLSDLEVPSSNGYRSKAREQLARQWSVGSD